MAYKQRKAKSLYALTSPLGEVGIFHQFGSIKPGTICVQNVIAQKYGNKENVTAEKGIYTLRHRNKPFLSMGNATCGYFKTPDGLYKVERISMADPRYLTAPVIQSYSDFFGDRAVRAIKRDAPVYPGEYKNHLKAVKLLDELLVSLGFVKATPKVAKITKRKASTKKHTNIQTLQQPARIKRAAKK